MFYEKICNTSTHFIYPWIYSFCVSFLQASLTKGYITYFDVRANKPVWETRAHDEGDVSCKYIAFIYHSRKKKYLSCTNFRIILFFPGLVLSTSCPGLLLSSSDDGLMKVWDIIEHEPTLVWQQEVPSIVVCTAANPDNGFVFGVCRTKKQSGKSAKVLDFSTIPEGTYKYF